MRYIKEFDSLRAIAVLSVMFSHYLSQYKFLGIFGAAGVTLFFVLSGYLITQILFQEKEYFKIDATQNLNKIWTVLKVFYIRRSLRIFPIYYLTLIVLVVLNIDSARQYWNYHFFYTSNFLYSFKIAFDHLSHFWSLAVEEQFYLLWPFVILLYPLKANKTNLFIALVIISLVFRCLMAYLYTVDSFAIHYMMPSCIESFAFGAIALNFVNKQINKNFVLGLLLSSFLIFAVLVALPPTSIIVKFGRIFSWTFFSIFCATLLLIIVQKTYHPILNYILNNKFLVWLGKISYGVYLYHMFVPGILEYLQLTFHFSLKGTGINFPLHFILSFSLAYLSFIIIEKPISGLKTKFAYK